jgi:hypothetical protein
MMRLRKQGCKMIKKIENNIIANNIPTNVIQNIDVANAFQKHETINKI